MLRLHGRNLAFTSVLAGIKKSRRKEQNPGRDGTVEVSMLCMAFDYTDIFSEICLNITGYATTILRKTVVTRQPMTLPRQHLLQHSNLLLHA